MSIWVAHIIRRKTKALNDPNFDMCFVVADSKEEAIRAVAAHDWPEDNLWKPGVSTCQIRKIYDLSSVPSRSIVSQYQKPPTSSQNLVELLVEETTEQTHKNTSTGIGRKRTRIRRHP